jgi:hypothetical protein
LIGESVLCEVGFHSLVLGNVDGTALPLSPHGSPDECL